MFFWTLRAAYGAGTRDRNCLQNGGRQKNRRTAFSADVLIIEDGNRVDLDGPRGSVSSSRQSANRVQGVALYASTRKVGSREVPRRRRRFIGFSGPDFILADGSFLWSRAVKPKFSPGDDSSVPVIFITLYPHFPEAVC